MTQPFTMTHFGTSTIDFCKENLPQLAHVVKVGWTDYPETYLNIPEKWGWCYDQHNRVFIVTPEQYYFQRHRGGSLIVEGNRAADPIWRAASESDLAKIKEGWLNRESLR